MPNLDIPFPLKGKDVNWSVEQQPPLTTSEVENVRPYDVIGERARGGQRPAVRRWSTNRIGAGDYRIDKIVQISRVT